MRIRVLICTATGLLVVAGFAIIPSVLPAILAWYRPDLTFLISTEDRRMFVTIDDAPSESTHRILEVLSKHGVPATFFVVADRVASSDQLDVILNAGHSVGNHLKTTQPSSHLTWQQFQSDFETCAEMLEHRQTARLYRPSSDLGTKAQTAFAKARGYRSVVGTVFPLDHWISNPRVLSFLIRWLSVRGGVIILHDGKTHGPVAAETLDQVIPQLRASGFTFGNLVDPD